MGDSSTLAGKQLSVGAPDHATLAPDEAVQFVRDAQGLVRDLLRPNVALHWLDFLTTITIAYAALAVYLAAADFSIVQVAALVVSGLAMYRAVIFTHEIVHRPAGSFRSFKFVWNLLCGIPILMPSFLYGDHRGHHINQAYGTQSDPEYFFLVLGRRMAVAFLLLAFVYPLLGPIRFLLLTPLAAVVQTLDRLIWTYTSSLYTMNAWYRRQYDASARSWSRWSQEIVCSAWGWTVVGLAVADVISWAMLWKVYLVFLFWIGVNQLRTLAAHRYANDGDPVSHFHQLLDTNTFPHGGILPELWAPLGLRFHALHHLLPSLPYHAMGEAHRRLMTSLPPDSPYHGTVRSGLWSVVADMMVRRLPRPH